MFRVKICGVTTPGFAQMATAAGASAVGLNFYRDSPRFVTREQAREIVAGLSKSVVKVGVFVNASADEIRETMRDVGLDMAQLHGDEPPESLAELKDLPVIRAFRCGDSLRPIRAYLERCAALQALPRAVLLDAASPGQYGGTGERVDWNLLAASRDELLGLPLILAGGLTPLNVGEAIATVRPTAVDVASGVESSPGVKSPSLTRTFVEEANRRFEAFD